MANYRIGKVRYSVDGIWDATTEYSILATVTNEAKTKVFVSKVDENINHNPEEDETSTYWELIVDADATVEAANEAAQAANEAAQAAEDIVDWVEQQVDSLTAYEVDTALSSSSIIPVQNKVVTAKFSEEDLYLQGDVRRLEVGREYATNEAVKTSSNEKRRMTQAVVAMKTTSVVATGELKAYNNATYKALKAISSYNSATTYTEGAYALGRPSVCTITVDISNMTQEGDISVIIGGVPIPNDIAVTSESTPASIAADIVSEYAEEEIQGWSSLVDNEDGTITITCLTAGANTLAFSFTDVNETGVVVSSTNVAGADTTSKFDGTSWSAATLAIMSADATLYANVPIETLISTYTTLNTLQLDVCGVTSEDYPEFVKFGQLYIASATKLQNNTTYTSALFRLKAGRTYTFNQVTAAVVNNQRAVATLASESQFVHNGTIKRFICSANKDNLVTGVKYTPTVDEFVVLQGRGLPLRQTWFVARHNVPDDKISPLESDINNLKNYVNGDVMYKAVTPIKYLNNTGIGFGGVVSLTNGITYLYKLEKGKTYNINSLYYSGSYGGFSGVFEIQDESYYAVNAAGSVKQITAWGVNKNIKCYKDTYIVTSGFSGNTTADAAAFYVVNEIVEKPKTEIDKIVLRSISMSASATSGKMVLYATGIIKANNNSNDSVSSYRVYAGCTYRISQKSSTRRTLACVNYRGTSAIPGSYSFVGEVLAVGYPDANNMTVVDYTPTEDGYVIVQNNMASITQVILQDAIPYLKNGTEERCVKRTDMTDVVVSGSSQTEADYQPRSFAWLERLNDILDLNFHNDGWSGYSFDANLVNMTTLTGNAPEYIGPRGVYTYKHRQISAKYYLFNNSANNTPYGATAYTQLQKAVEIAKSFGAKVLFANEAALGDDKIAYTRRAFCKKHNIPYVSVLEELKKCYPCSAVGASTNRMPYAGWFVNQHLGYRAFAIYERYIEMLEKIPINKSVKLFKVRPMYKEGSPTASQLAYDDNYQRLRFFTAIGCGSLPARNTAQIDNLDNTNYAVTGGENIGVNTNENAAIKIGNSVSFNKFAAIEFILDRVKIKKGTFKININVVPTNVYVSVLDTVSSSMGYRTRWQTITFTRNNSGLLVANISRSYPDVQLEDKIKFLIECDGSFTLANPEFRDYDGILKQYKEDSIEGYHERLYGTELNPQTGFPTSGHGWSFTGNASVVALPSQIANYTAYNSYNSHLQLDDNAASATKTISITSGISRVAIRVVCCAYPKIATTRYNVDGEVPTALQPYVANDAPQIRNYEYDYGTMVLTINDCAVNKATIWPGWAEYYFEIDIPPTSTSIKLTIGREFFTEATYNVNSWKMFVHDVSVQKIM